MEDRLIVLPTIVEFEWIRVRSPGLHIVERNILFRHSAAGRTIIVESMRDCLGCNGCVLKGQAFTPETDFQGIILERLSHKRIRCTTTYTENKPYSQTPCMDRFLDPKLVQMVFRAQYYKLKFFDED